MIEKIENLKHAIITLIVHSYYYNNHISFVYIKYIELFELVRNGLHASEYLDILRVLNILCYACSTKETFVQDFMEKCFLDTSNYWDIKNK